MRIALIGNAPDTLLRFRSDLIRSMISSGHSVHAFSPGYSQEQQEDVRSLGAVPVPYTLERTSTNPIEEVKLIGQFRKLFREHEIGVVFSYFVKPVIYGSIAARLEGIDHVYSMLGGLGYLFTDGNGAAPGLKKRVLKTVVTPLFRFALRQNRVVFFQNPDDRDEFIKRRLVKREQTARIYGSGVDLSEYAHSSVKRKPFTFLAAGRLLAEKGFREYAKAAEIIKKNHPDVRFVLLGGHDENPASLTKEEVENWDATGILECPGMVDNVNRWLQETTVFVLPSYREGTPRSTLEALATGLPVITTDVPGCRETVNDGANGYLVPPRDPVALAGAMQKIIDNPEYAQKMGDESRKLAETYYDVRKVNKSILEKMNLLIY